MIHASSVAASNSASICCLSAASASNSGEASHWLPLHFWRASAGGVGTPYPAPKVLVVAPPPLAPMPHFWFQGMFDGGHEKTKELGKYYESLCSFLKIDFLNAGEYITTDGVDGIHFTADNNTELGKAIASKVRSIFDPNEIDAAA